MRLKDGTTHINGLRFDTPVKREKNEVAKSSPWSIALYQAPFWALENHMGCVRPLSSHKPIHPSHRIDKLGSPSDSRLDPSHETITLISIHQTTTRMHVDATLQYTQARDDRASHVEHDAWHRSHACTRPNVRVMIRYKTHNQHSRVQIGSTPHRSEGFDCLERLATPRVGKSIPPFYQRLFSEWTCHIEQVE